MNYSILFNKSYSSDNFVAGNIWHLSHQRPVPVRDFPFKRPWDYIFHNFRYTFQKLQISPQSVNLKVIKVFQVSNLISVAIESSDRPVNSRESFEWWKIEEKWGNLKSLLFAHSDQFKRLQWAFLGQKLKKIFQNGPNKLKTGIKVGFWPILTSFLGCFSQSGKELKRRIFELYILFLKRCFCQN